MKNILVVTAIAILLVLSGCPKPEEPPIELKALVTISTSEGFNSTYYMTPFHKKISQVPGFEHQYDTCFLTVTNQGAPSGANQFQQINLTEPVFYPVSLSKGIYSFYVETNEDPLAIDFDKSFIAYSQPDSVRAGAIYELVLPQEVKQALVLVDANTVTGTPEVEVGLTKLPMQRQGDWWYAYTLGPAGVYAIINGNEVIKGTPFNQGDIYIWVAVEGRITTQDGHINIFYL